MRILVRLHAKKKYSKKKWKAVIPEEHRMMKMIIFLCFE